MKYFFSLLLIFSAFTAFCQTASEAQQKIVTWSATITDSQTITHTLTNVTVSGYNYFHCILKNAMFKMSFEKIRTITFAATPQPPFKGYMQSTVTYSAGGQTQMFIDTDNYRIEGLNEILQVKIKIPLSEVTSITLTQVTVPILETGTEEPGIPVTPPESVSSMRPARPQITEQFFY